ncbi:transferase family-domain-containing protein [Aspergillus carlsbadensis]|nr:transferase family-domain-containing protein [Aspergillus carlsbadensis]
MPSSTPKITVSATHVVHSQHPVTIPEPFILGPFDQLGHFATPVSAVWIYESASEELIPPERLHKATSRLLDYYPHLTGRLHISPDTDVRTMTRLGSGIHLLEANCDVPLRSFSRGPSAAQEFSVFDFPGYGNALLAPWDMSLEGAQSEPVLMIQRTQFACGAVAIGMTLSHVVSGARGFLGLYQDLAEIYRAIARRGTGGEVNLASPPYLAPFMVDAMWHMDADKLERALSECPAGYLLREKEAAAENAAEAGTEPKVAVELDSSDDPYIGRSLRFSPSALATLKSRAVDPESSIARVSSFCALSAHLWQRIHIARLANAESYSEKEKAALSSPTLGTSVDFVPHLGLSPRTFGNTVTTPVINLSSTTLARAPLWEIADLISSRVRHVSADEVHKLGTWIAAHPRKSQIQLNFQPSPAAFIATGWHRFPLYSGAELDRPPVFASPVPMEALFDGMVLFVEPKARDRGVEAIVFLKRSTWEVLDRDEEFITTWC